MSAETIGLRTCATLVSEPVRPGTRPDALYLGLETSRLWAACLHGNGQASNMRSNTSAFEPGDVLYGKLRPYLDKAILADEPGVCTTELLVLRAKSGVDSRFLATVVHSPNFLEHAITGTTGVQHPRTSWAHIRDFEVPAFTLDDQRKVAGILCSSMKRLVGQKRWWKKPKNLNMPRCVRCSHAAFEVSHKKKPKSDRFQRVGNAMSLALWLRSRMGLKPRSAMP